MPNRRTPPGLKLLGPQGVKAVPPEVVGATLGGVGLDFARVPTVLDEAGRAAWAHLAATYESTPTRFREGDRAAVSTFCLAVSLHERAAQVLLAAGLTVQGRSSADRGRQVKAPAFQLWRDTSTQLRYWARELGLTPDARGRSGIRDAEPHDPHDPRNPFAGGPPFLR